MGLKIYNLIGYKALYFKKEGIRIRIKDIW